MVSTADSESSVKNSKLSNPKKPMESKAKADEFREDTVRTITDHIKHDDDGRQAGGRRQEAAGAVIGCWVVVERSLHCYIATRNQNVAH